MSDLPPPRPGEQPAWQPPAGPPPGATPEFTPTSIMPTTPPARSGLRSRWLAVIGAIIAVALGAAVVLWATRSKDDDSPDTASGTSDSTDASATDASAVVETTAPEPTSSSEPPPTTGAPVVLPTTPPTAAPTAPAATAAPAGSVLPAPPVPAGATLFSDPAGWTIAIDPSWQRQQSEQFSGWFTGTGSTGFSDNVNVVIETLPNPLSLDDYVGAATGVINTQAADVEIVDQRRLIGDDGVEVHVITWLGTVVGANQRLAFVQAMTVTTTKAYVATFTSQPGRLADLALSIGPYLATIRGT